MKIKENLSKLTSNLAIPAVIVFLTIYYWGSSAETSVNHKDYRMRSRLYTSRLSVIELKRELETIISRLTTYFRAWKVTGNRLSENKKELWINVTIPVLAFKDDLTLKVRFLEGPKIQVDLVSKSRVGKNDLGENQRHVLQLLEALDKFFYSEKK